MKLFISYSRSDMPTCRIINNYLADVHDTWYDVRLRSHKPWWETIIEQIQHCDMFIYLLSSKSISSEWCQKEFAFAKKKDKIILPILLEAGILIPEKIREIQHIQMLDMSNGVTNIHNVTKLLNSITLIERELCQSYIGNGASTRPAPPPPPYTKREKRSLPKYAPITDNSIHKLVKIFHFKEHNGWVRSIDWSPDGFKACFR